MRAFMDKGGNIILLPRRAAEKLEKAIREDKKDPAHKPEYSIVQVRYEICH